MTDETAMKDQALAAADSLLATYDFTRTGQTHEALRALLAIAWVEGRQAGGMEAKAAIERIAEKLQ